MNERYVLGEGYGLGKGIVRDGPHKGKFAWVGLTTHPGLATACPLALPSAKKIKYGRVSNPETRRKFRLVLEVVEDAPEPGSPEYVKRFLDKASER